MSTNKLKKWNHYMPKSIVNINKVTKTRVFRFWIRHQHCVCHSSNEYTQHTNYVPLGITVDRYLGITDMTHWSLNLCVGPLSMTFSVDPNCKKD